MLPSGLVAAPDITRPSNQSEAGDASPRSMLPFRRSTMLQSLPLLAPVLWLALFLRVVRLDAQSLWSDEGISAVMAGRSIPEILVNAAGDVHPPLYYLLLRGWAPVAGANEIGLRSLSVWFGVLTVAAGYVLARRLFGRGAALACALMLSASPYLLHYSQEARMYAPLAFWATLTLYFAVRFAGGVRPTRWTLAGYAVSAAALCLTQYFGVAYLLAPFVAVAVLRPPLPRNLRWWGWWAAGIAAVFGLVLPWALYVLPHIPSLTTGGDVLGRRAFLTLAAETLVFGRAASLIEPANLSLMLGAVATAAVGLMLSLFLGPPRLRGPRSLIATGILLAACLLPVAALYALTLRRAFYFPEYMKLLLPVIPPAAVLLAGGFTSLGAAVGHAVPRTAVARVLPLLTAIGGIAVVVLAVAPALVAYASDSRLARDDYRGLVEHIARSAKAGDAVILDAPEQTEIFNYYARGAWDQYRLPASRPIDDEATRQQLSEIAGKHQRIWVVLWAWQEADPRRVVETWLNSNAFRTADRWFGNVQLALYAVPWAGEGGLTAEIGADFGDGAVLERVEIPGAEGYGLTVQPGGGIPVTLEWRASATPQRRYRAFVHLTGDDRVPWTQHDSEPGGGTALTTGWKTGDVIADRHGLTVPLGTPPGRYHLLAGLYDAATGVRRVPQGQPAQEDTARVLTITITEGDPPPLSSLPIRNRLSARLGPLEIIGADLEPVGANGAGGDLKAQAWADVLLYWRASSTPDRPYRVALSLRLDGNEAARQESRPAAQFPTDEWDAGTIVRDQRRMLLTVPPGTYQLVAELLAEDGTIAASARLPDVVVTP